jgi:hypothetical protein
MNIRKAFAIQYPSGEIAPLAFPSEEALIGYLSLGNDNMDPEEIRKRLAKDNLRVVEVKLFTIS